MNDPAVRSTSPATHPAVAALVATGFRSDRFRAIELDDPAAVWAIEPGATTIIWGTNRNLIAAADLLGEQLGALASGSRAAIVGIDALDHNPQVLRPRLLVRASPDSTAIRAVLSGTDSSPVSGDDAPTWKLLALVVEATINVGRPDAQELERLAGAPAFADLKPSQAAKALSIATGADRSDAYAAISRARQRTDNAPP